MCCNCLLLPIQPRTSPQKNRQRGGKEQQQQPKAHRNADHMMDSNGKTVISPRTAKNRIVAPCTPAHIRDLTAPKCQLVEGEVIRGKSYFSLSEPQGCGRIEATSAHRCDILARCVATLATTVLAASYDPRTRLSGNDAAWQGPHSRPYGTRHAHILRALWKKPPRFPPKRVGRARLKATTEKRFGHVLPHALNKGWPVFERAPGGLSAGERGAIMWPVKDLRHE